MKVDFHLNEKFEVESGERVFSLRGWRKKKSATAATFLSPPPSLHNATADRRCSTFLYVSSAIIHVSVVPFASAFRIIIDGRRSSSTGGMAHHRYQPDVRPIDDVDRSTRDRDGGGDDSWHWSSPGDIDESEVESK